MVELDYSELKKFLGGYFCIISFSFFLISCDLFLKIGIRF